MTDQEIVLRALTELQLIAADYIEPGPRDAQITMQVMLSILNRRDVVAAAIRLSKGYGLRVVKIIACPSKT
jgi:hypothetical protein